MIRLLARWWAKRSYIWQLEVESAKSDINADLAAGNTQERRALIEKLNSEAAEIEANIKQVEAEEEVRKETDEYKALTPQEKYLDEHAAKKERHDAEGMVAEKRRIASSQDEDIAGGEQTEKHLRSLANNSRNIADKIRKL